MTPAPATDVRHVVFDGRRTARTPRLQPSARAGCDWPPTRPGRCASAEPKAEQDAFLAWLLARSGLNPGLYRLNPLLRRVPACLRALRVSSPEAARQRLERDPDLLDPALDALLIGVTAFFRDPAVFECLRTDVLPALARTRERLRVWSAGCSSGAELYSVAIVLAELGLLGRSALLGTDCRPAAVRTARRGAYPAGALDGLAPAVVTRYFRQEGAELRVDLPRCADIDWRTADLGHAVEPGPWDLILFRNTSIYMARGSAERIWCALAQSLSAGGVLVTGKAERPHVEPLSAARHCICRKGGACP